MYGIEILSSYMATFAVFIHTLVFKNILTNKQGAMLYQAGYPCGCARAPVYRAAASPSSVQAGICPAPLSDRPRAAVCDRDH